MLWYFLAGGLQIRWILTRIMRPAFLRQPSGWVILFLWLKLSCVLPCSMTCYGLWLVLKSITGESQLCCICLIMSIFHNPRVVGGLLSAYDLSSDQVFLDKARDIADRLLPAWDTPSGIPYNIINLAHGRPHNPGWTGVSLLLLYRQSSLSS